MFLTNTKVSVNNNGAEETGLILKVIKKTVFVKLDVDGVILPFDITQVKKY